MKNNLISLFIITLLTIFLHTQIYAQNHQCRFKDSLVLLDVRRLAHANGNWAIEWDPTKPMDTWFGIHLNNNGCVTSFRTQPTNGWGFNQNFRGKLSPRIVELAHLDTLHLGNVLLDVIPQDIGKLQNLRYLYIGNCTLTEETNLPASIGELSKLQFFMINSASNLTGRIPKEVGNLSELRVLRLRAAFTGGIPKEIGNLSNLERLEIIDNFNLGGRIPRELDRLSKLKVLNLKRNKLGGGIPRELDKLNLLGLYLQHNELGGSIPLNLKVNTYLDLSYNNFSGILPSTLFTKDFTPVDINLSHNRFTGLIPAKLGDLDLRNVDISHNEFEGFLPSSLGNAFDLYINSERKFLVNDNKLSGCYPLSYSSLCGMETNFSNNIDLPSFQTVCNSGAFEQEDFVGWTATKASSETGNYAIDVKTQLDNLDIGRASKKHKISANRIPIGGEHNQGLAYLSNWNGLGRSILTRNDGGGIILSFHDYFDLKDWIYSPSRIFFDHSISFNIRNVREYGSHDHPGGCQAQGNYIAVAMEQGLATHAAIYFLKADGNKISYISTLSLDGSKGEPYQASQNEAATVGFVKLKNGTYLVAVPGKGHGQQGIWFYQSVETEITPSTSWNYIGFYEPNCKGYGNVNDDCYVGAGGGLNLIVDEQGKVYLFAMTGTNGAGKDYEYLQVFELNKNSCGEILLRKIAQYRDKVGRLATIQFSFRWAGGSYIANDGTIIIANSERKTIQDSNSSVDGDLYFGRPILDSENIQPQLYLDTISVVKDNFDIENEFLHQNVPNPFTEGTRIAFELPLTFNQASIQITDISGKVIRQFVLEKGSQKIHLTNNFMPDGFYFYSLIIDGKAVETKKMLIKN